MINLDHNATTPLESEVLDAMLPYLRQHHANPSSLHTEGRLARAAIDQAREQVASLIGASPSQIIFTSGGTEANNLIIQGVCARHPGELIVVSSVEHSSILRQISSIMHRGNPLLTIPVNEGGVVTEASMKEMLTENPRLISLMLANNETGAIQPVARLAQLAAEHPCWVHTDASQALGKIEVDFQALGVHFMTLSSHKIYGPKGLGALVVDRSIEIEPLIYGGGHEQGLRGGTENVAGIVGFGAAACLAGSELKAYREHLLRLRNHFETGLREIPGVQIFSQHCDRVANTSLFSVSGIEGETLVMNMDRRGFAMSSGSACSANNNEPSHVLLVMGVDEQIARCAVRVSFGKSNSVQDVDAVLKALKEEQEQMTTFGAISGW